MIIATTRTALAGALCHLRMDALDGTDELLIDNDTVVEIAMPISSSVQSVPLGICDNLELFEEDLTIAGTAKPRGTYTNAHFAVKEISRFDEAIRALSSSQRSPFSSNVTKELAIMADTLVIQASVESDFALPLDKLVLAAREVVFKGSLVIHVRLGELLDNPLNYLLSEEVRDSDEGIAILKRTFGNIEVYSMITSQLRKPYMTEAFSAKLPMKPVTADLIAICAYKLREENHLVFVDNMINTYRMASKVVRNAGLSKLARSMHIIQDHMPRLFNLSSLKDRELTIRQVQDYVNATGPMDSNQSEVVTVFEMPSETLSDMLLRLDSLVVILESLDESNKKIGLARHSLQQDYNVTIQKLKLRESSEQYFVETQRQQMKYEILLRSGERRLGKECCGSGWYWRCEV